MEENKVGIHRINLTERNNITISGVLKVLSSNNAGIILKLKESNLCIGGNELSIDSFNDGQILITGTLDSLKYSKSSKVKEGFFKRIFK